MKKALVWANEMVRYYVHKLEKVFFCCVDDDEGTSVGTGDIHEVGAHSFERMLAN